MFNAVISRFKGMNHLRNEDDGPQLFLPSGAPPLTVSHLSTPDVRGIAFQVASESVSKMDRPSLLALAHSKVRDENCLKWEVQTGKVTSLFFWNCKRIAPSMSWTYGNAGTITQSCV